MKSLESKGLSWLTVSQSEEILMTLMYWVMEIITHWKGGGNNCAWTLPKAVSAQLIWKPVLLHERRSSNITWICKLQWNACGITRSNWFICETLESKIHFLWNQNMFALCLGVRNKHCAQATWLSLFWCLADSPGVYSRTSTAWGDVWSRDGLILCFRVSDVVLGTIMGTITNPETHSH